MEKKNKYQGNSSQQDAEIFKYLKSINTLIKETKSRAKGYSKLKEIDKDSLSVGLLIYYYYVEGKYHSLNYRETGNIESLERANDSYDELIYTARDNGTFVKNPKFLFVRCHCKFQLAKVLTKKSSKQFFHDHSKFLAEKALQYNPDNVSFQWLIKEINSTSI